MSLVEAESEALRDAVMVELRKAYPEVVVPSSLVETTGAPVAELRAVVAELMQAGVARASGEGWVFAQGDDDDVPDDLPIPAEAQPTPGAAAELAGQQEEAEVGELPAITITEGEDGRRYEAVIATKITFSGTDAEEAVDIAQICAALIRKELEKATQDIDIVTALERVDMFSEPQTIYDAEKENGNGGEEATG